MISKRADWLTIDNHLPYVIFHALSRVMDKRSSVFPLISVVKDEIPRRGWKIRTAAEKKKKMILDITLPELESKGSAAVISRIKQSSA